MSTPKTPPSQTPEPQKAAGEGKTPAKEGHAPRATGKVIPPGNPVGWSGLLVSVVVVAIQAAFQFNAPGVSPGTSNPLNSVLLFVSLVGGVVAAVLGIVALSSRRAPAWPGWVTLGVGLDVFLVSVAAWLGSIAAAA